MPLKSKVYPNKAPTPIQYQYPSVNIPRDFRIASPSDVVEFGRTYRKKRNLINYNFECFKIYFPISNKLTWCQLFPRNSFTAIAFCPYISGEIQ